LATYHAIKIGRNGLRNPGLTLHQNSDLPLIAQGVLRSRDRSLSPNSDWYHHPGKQNEIADWIMISASDGGLQ